MLQLEKLSSFMKNGTQEVLITPQHRPPLSYQSKKTTYTNSASGLGVMRKRRPAMQSPQAP
ncbi:hypothetical protein PSHT_04283 [Puccinia striiformis]|nr:hypothetical protein PSHT_04283 [Puccinia striiformis]